MDISNNSEKKLRKAISCVVFNKNKKFLMVCGAKWPKGSWCFPQGGINENETHREAVKRELNEELGTNNFDIIGKSIVEHVYLFPEEIAQKKGFDGQYQTIWFVKLLEEESKIKFPEEEISEAKWFEQDEIIENMAFPEQKETFKKVVEELTKLFNERII